MACDGLCAAEMPLKRTTFARATCSSRRSTLSTNYDRLISLNSDIEDVRKWKRMIVTEGTNVSLFARTLSLPENMGSRHKTHQSKEEKFKSSFSIGHKIFNMPCLSCLIDMQCSCSLTAVVVILFAALSLTQLCSHVVSWPKGGFLREIQANMLPRHAHLLTRMLTAACSFKPSGHILRITLARCTRV